MTQIKHSGLDSVAKEHASKVFNYINKNSFSNAEKKYFTDEKIFEILTAKPDELQNYTIIDKEPMRLNFKKMKFAFVGSDSSGKRDGAASGYNKFSKKNNSDYNAYILTKELGVNVCPYCNRNYTFTSQSKNGSTRPFFDHFYDKGKYPFLALSFYNLIPCCNICNSSYKTQKKFCVSTHIHPYIKDLNKIIKFQFAINSIDSFYKYDALSLEFVKSKQDVSDEDFKKATNNIDALGLKDIYQNHKDIALEIIQKAEMYNDSYIDELLKNYEGTLFKNREDLLRQLFGGYVTDDDIGKRPLSKLTKDILEQLEII